MSKTSREISLDDAFIHDHMHSGPGVMKYWVTYCDKNMIRRRQRHVLTTHKEYEKLMKGCSLCHSAQRDDSATGVQQLEKKTCDSAAATPTKFHLFSPLGTVRALRRVFVL